MLTQQPSIDMEEDDAIEFHSKQKLKAKFNCGKNQVFTSTKTYGTEDVMNAANGTLGGMSSE